MYTDDYLPVTARWLKCSMIIQHLPLRCFNQNVAGDGIHAVFHVPVHFQHAQLGSAFPGFMCEDLRNAAIKLSRFPSRPRFKEGNTHVGVVELNRSLRALCTELMPRVLKTLVALRALNV